jgi:hypothetical protein
MKAVAENYGYTCTLIEVSITDRPEETFEVQGVHLLGRQNSDVTILDVLAILTSFHNDLFFAFINLEAVQLYRTGIEVIDS